MIDVPNSIHASSTDSSSHTVLESQKMDYPSNEPIEKRARMCDAQGCYTIVLTTAYPLTPPSQTPSTSKITRTSSDPTKPTNPTTTARTTTDPSFSRSAIPRSSRSSLSSRSRSSSSASSEPSNTVVANAVTYFGYYTSKGVIENDDNPANPHGAPEPQTSTFDGPLFKRNTFDNTLSMVDALQACADAASLQPGVYYSYNLYLLDTTALAQWVCRQYYASNTDDSYFKCERRKCR